MQRLVNEPWNYAQDLSGSNPAGFVLSLIK